MRHPILPQKKTVEELALWLTENAIDKRSYVEKTPLTEAEIHEQQAKVANAVAAIYELDQVSATFKQFIKKGTDTILNEKGDPQYQPISITIPPTKGMEALENNKKFASDILKAGHTTTMTDVYGIPDVEKKLIVFFNIEGAVIYDEPMNDDQIKAFSGGLFGLD